MNPRSETPPRIWEWEVRNGVATWRSGDEMTALHTSIALRHVAAVERQEHHVRLIGRVLDGWIDLGSTIGAELFHQAVIDALEARP